MNDAQRLLVIIALVVIGVVLAWLMLDWANGFSGGTSILVFYEVPDPDPRYPNLIDRYGIYTARGVPYMLGVLLGMVLPLCLFATAAFLAFGVEDAGSLTLPWCNSTLPYQIFGQGLFGVFHQPRNQ